MGRIKETYIVAVNLANVGDASICDGDDFDELGVLDRLRLLGRKAGPQVHAPVGAEPQQALDGDDASAPDKGPLLSSNVLLVQIRRKVVSKEDGPYYDERPDICVPL